MDIPTLEAALAVQEARLAPLLAAYREADRAVFRATLARQRIDQLLPPYQWEIVRLQGEIERLQKEEAEAKKRRKRK